MTVRAVTFNVRQTNTLDHQRADLTVRMARADVVLVQECVHLDLHAFVKAQPGWSAFQVRDGDDDGHANTAVLYRTMLATTPATDIVFLGDAKDTRSRYLAAVELAAWFGAAHIFPGRDESDVAEQLHHLGAWCKAHPGPKVIGLDRNQCPIRDLEHATGLKWHGIGIDGFLTNLPTSDPTAFAKGFSDHQGVSAVVTTPKPPKKPVRKHRIPQATDLLLAALASATAHGKQEKATRIQRALNALTARAAKPRHWFQAISRARKQSHEGPKFKAGFCLQRVRLCYGIPAVAGSATVAWNIAKTKHRTTNPADVPRGYPVFWSGGSDGDGHIAIAAGNGKCWSTDISRPGFFDYVDITEIHAKWGLTLLGYTKDLNGRPIK